MLFFAVLTSIIVSLSVHEFAHAFAATLLGDDTAERQGRLTFNPLVHIDISGLLLLVFAGFGWGKPVPYNPNNLRNRRVGEALVALAGPLSNLLLVIIIGIALKILISVGVITSDNMLLFFFYSMIQINVVLMVFNLIPIPPLDGSKILFSILPPKYHYVRMFLERNGMFILFGILMLDSFSSISIFGTLFSSVLRIVESIFQL